MSQGPLLILIRFISPGPLTSMSNYGGAHEATDPSPNDDPFVHNDFGRITLLPELNIEDWVEQWQWDDTCCVKNNEFGVLDHPFEPHLTSTSVLTYPSFPISYPTLSSTTETRSNVLNGVQLPHTYSEDFIPHQQVFEPNRLSHSHQLSSISINSTGTAAVGFLSQSLVLPRGRRRRINKRPVLI